MILIANVRGSLNRHTHLVFLLKLHYKARTTLIASVFCTFFGNFLFLIELRVNGLPTLLPIEHRVGK